MNQSEILKLYNTFILEENNLKQKQIKNNNSLIDNYIKVAGLITQQDEDQQTQDDTQETEQTEDIEQQESDTQQEEDTEQSQNKEQNNTDQKTQLKFSADLASEFGNTVNQFTKTAAEVIKQRAINKETSDKIYDLMAKIKNLLDAAGKSI